MAERKCGPVVTENGNYIVDWKFDRADVQALASRDWLRVREQIINIPGANITRFAVST